MCRSLHACAMEAPAWRVNAPLIPAAEPSRLNSEPQKPQLTVARETSRVMTFEWNSNDVTDLSYRDGDFDPQV